MTAHLLVVEDEAKIAAVLRDYLQAADFRVSLLDRGDAVLPWLAQHVVDAILLDVMLPGMDGLEICRTLRRDSTLPVLMLTARVEDIDRLLGLELGADDYICKPFNPREVVLRVKAVLRRASATSSATSRLPFVLDADRFEVRVGERALALTPVEFRLLSRLAARPGRIHSRDQLLDAIYDDHRVVSDRTVDSHVRNLRRKFEELGLDPIESVYGVGFRLEI